MTAMSMTLPLERVTPVRVPTRDLVLGGTDSLTLLVSIVERDSPDALPIAITGGIGGPAVSMFVWPAPYGHGMGNCQDYGWGYWHNGPVASPGTVLWATTGTVSNATTGTFALAVPAGTIGTWPRRCRWAIYFDDEGGGAAELLAEGHLHVRPMVSRPQAPLILLTDEPRPVLTDTIILSGTAV